MSYAEQFWGVKENKTLEYVNDLAMFGVNSATYNNEDAMDAVLDDEIAGFINPIANYYIYQYIKTHGLDVTDYLHYGFKIAIYNHAYNSLMIFKLLDFPASNTNYCKWIDTDGWVVIPSYTGANDDGSGVLNMEDYTSVQFMNGSTKNWYKEWNEFNSGYDTTFYDSKILTHMPPLYMGFNAEVKNNLVPIKSGIGTNSNLNIYIGVPSYDDFSNALLRGIFPESDDPSYPFKGVVLGGAYLDGYSTMYAHFVDKYLPNDSDAIAHSNLIATYVRNVQAAALLSMEEITTIRSDLETVDRPGIRRFRLKRYAELSPSLTDGKIKLKMSGVAIMPIILM